MGGHFTELMGLKDLFPLYKSILVTDNINATKDKDDYKCFFAIEYPTAWAIHRKETAGITSTHSRWQNFSTYAKMMVQCIRIFYKYKPAVIVSTGSYIAVPLFLVGKLHGSKTIFIESVAKVYTKTLTGKIVGRLSNKVYVQWPEMQNSYSNSEYHGLLV